MFRVCIGFQSLASILAEAEQAKDGSETGGILLGFDPDHRGVIRITGVTGAGPHAERTPHRFLRDRDFAQRAADNAFSASGAEWVGEWHTHPAGSSGPSATDLETYRSFLSDDSLGFYVFTCLIATPGSPSDLGQTALTPWLVERDRMTQPLLLVEHGPE